MVNSKSEIPSRTILAPVNLSKIYNRCVEKTKEQIKLSTKYPSITCDSWCDKYEHRSYFCMTIHFLDSNLQLHRYCLKTQPFDDVHTGEKIKELVSKVLLDYGINPSNVIVVSVFTIQKFQKYFSIWLGIR